MALILSCSSPSHAAETGSFTQRLRDVHRIAETVDINAMLGRHVQNRQLINARRFLLDRIWMMLEDESLTDFKKLAILAAMRSSVAGRLDLDTDQVCPGPDYQPPASARTKASAVPVWREPIRTPEARREQRSRPRMRASRHSEPQIILYHKLKRLGAEELEQYRAHESSKAAARRERRELQATMDLLNGQLADLDLYDDLLSPRPCCMDDVVREELAARSGGLPKRQPPAKLQLAQTQGMLQLLQDKHDRYAEERIFPFDFPSPAEPWWKKRSHSLSLRKKRSSYNSFTSADTILSISPEYRTVGFGSASLLSPSLVRAGRTRRFFCKAKKLKAELWGHGTLETISEE